MENNTENMNVPSTSSETQPKKPLTKFDQILLSQLQQSKQQKRENSSRRKQRYRQKQKTKKKDELTSKEIEQSTETESLKRSATEVRSQAESTHVAKRKQPTNLIDASIESATEKGVEMETKVNDNHYDVTEEPKVTD